MRTTRRPASQGDAVGRPNGPSLRQASLFDPLPAEPSAPTAATGGAEQQELFAETGPPTAQAGLLPSLAAATARPAHTGAATTTSAAGDPWVEALARAASLQELEAIVRECRRCPLRAGCRQVVFGEGNPRARLMLVGEGPGQVEDETGRPFVGPAGQLLDRMLAAIGLRREEVYIANVVKCRPPNNRVPTPEEAAACWPNLRRQMELVQPEIVLCLGATAARQLVDPKGSITSLRGRWFQRDGVRYLVTFHPAALLRDPSKKILAWQDLQRLQEALQHPPAK